MATAIPDIPVILNRVADRRAGRDALKEQILAILRLDPDELTAADLKKRLLIAEVLSEEMHPIDIDVGDALNSRRRLVHVLERDEQEKRAKDQAKASRQGERPARRGQLQQVYANTSRDCGHWSFWVDGKIYELLFQPRPAGGSSEQESSGISDLHVTDAPVRSQFFNDLVGFTELNHTEIYLIGKGIIDAKYKNYNRFVNNCQGYTRDLLKAVLTHPIKALTTTSTKVIFGACLLVLVLVVFATIYWVNLASKENLEALHRQLNLDIKDAEIRIRSLPLMVQSGAPVQQLPVSWSSQPHNDL